MMWNPRMETMLRAEPEALRPRGPQNLPLLSLARTAGPRQNDPLPLVAVPRREAVRPANRL